MKKVFALSMIAASGWANSVHAQDIMVVEMNDNTVYEYNVKDIDDVSFRYVGDLPSDSIAYHNCPDEHHPHLIDLGLPSGTKWACCNVGASMPQEYGGYYAWGETEEKDIYNDVTYIYSSGTDTNGDGFYDEDISYQNIGDNIAGTEYDVAKQKWGGSWKMPTVEQCRELDLYCDSEWTTCNGVNGYLFTGASGGSIFLPAGGHRSMWFTTFVDSYGYYWTSAPFDSGSIHTAYDYYFSSVYVVMEHCDMRFRGKSVRAVCQ